MGGRKAMETGVPKLPGWLEFGGRGGFWGGNGWRYEGYEELALPEEPAAKLPTGASIFLYHCRDDEIIPFEHLTLYAQVLPQAAVRELDAGGHQLNNDLSEVARDIKALQ